VTLFFIDTSPNIIATLNQIYTLLKPGGIWINLGPLKWGYGGWTVMELSLEEVVQAAELTGFRLKELNPESDEYVERVTKEINCEYTTDKQAMLKWSYEARFWVAERVS
jgi:carnosine N-methyltransferase